MLIGPFKSGFRVRLLYRYLADLRWALYDLARLGYLFDCNMGCSRWDGPRRR